MHMNFVLSRTVEMLHHTIFTSWYVLILSILSRSHSLMSREGPKGKGTLSCPVFSFPSRMSSFSATWLPNTGMLHWKK